MQIAAFFATGEVPVSAVETIELYAFMEAAAESTRRGGQRVTIAEVMEKGEADAKVRLQAMLGPAADGE